MMREEIVQHDVAVVGGGPAGLAACALLVSRGIRPAHVTGVKREMRDPRTAALMQGTLPILDTLGLWPGLLKAQSAPLWTLRLIDETRHLIRAPSITFDARELGDEPFGWNIPNATLADALREIIPDDAVATYEGLSVTWTEPRDTLIKLHLSDGRILRVRAVIAADGGESRCRGSAGIKTYGADYRQQAIATSFGHSLPHHDCSTERHRENGPLTTVPLPGNRSSLVWMDRPDEIKRLMALDDRTFAAELERYVGGELGAVSDIGPRRAFPARTMIARQFAAKRTFLVGEAGHVLPPIGAQGLNLGLRDAKAAAWLIADALAYGEDPGGAEPLTAYDQARQRDVVPRGIGIDLMNRSLLSRLLPAQAGRVLAVGALAQIAPLRRAVMRGGLGIGH
ncbi:FAD-dependent monooxygenase [Rhodoligotrophos ferricapiens]|uniref:FAD-dependent monooxygenase n=1 Tax=Rhodoligotrophos ferricapiens TaxID=3069264 RepID=UPI00315C5CC5